MTRILVLPSAVPYLPRHRRAARLARALAAVRAAFTLPAGP